MIKNNKKLTNFDRSKLYLKSSKVSARDLSKNPFLAFSDHPKNYHIKSMGFLKKIKHSDITVDRLFYSDENVEIIQKQIILQVFKRSNGKYKIPKQDFKRVISVMKYIFEEEGLHLPTNVTEQIRALNNSVVKLIIPDIINNIEQYFGYLRDISTPLNPPPLPESTNAFKVLPSRMTKGSRIQDL